MHKKMFSVTKHDRKTSKQKKTLSFSIIKKVEILKLKYSLKCIMEKRNLIIFLKFTHMINTKTVDKITNDNF